MIQLWPSSLRLATMIWSSTCSCTVGFSTGHKSSTLRARLRGIQSADEMKTLASGDGSGLPLPKQTMRACSRKRPIMLLTPVCWPRTRHAGTRAADAADHQIDLHAGLRGGVEPVDQPGVDQGIELGPDCGGTA